MISEDVLDAALRDLFERSPAPFSISTIDHDSAGESFDALLDRAHGLMYLARFSGDRVDVRSGLIEHRLSRGDCVVAPRRPRKKDIEAEPNEKRFNTQFDWLARAIPAKVHSRFASGIA